MQRPWQKFSTLAVVYGQKELLDYLLDKCSTDADKRKLLNAKTNDGKSLAHGAVTYGEKGMLDYLLSKYSTNEERIPHNNSGYRWHEFSTLCSSKRPQRHFR